MIARIRICRSTHIQNINTMDIYELDLVPTNVTTTTNVTIVALTTNVTVFWKNLTTNVTITTNITHFLMTNVVMNLSILLDKRYSTKLTTNVTA